MVVVILKLQFDVYEFVRAMQFTRSKGKQTKPLEQFLACSSFLWGGPVKLGRMDLVSRRLQMKSIVDVVDVSESQ